MAESIGIKVIATSMDRGCIVRDSKKPSNQGRQKLVLANLNSIKIWQQFRQAFSGTFLVEKSLTEKWEDMKKKQQRPGKDTREYFFDKVRLCELLNFGLDETKRQIAIGLLSRDTSNAILNQGHFDLDDTRRSIVAHESVNESRRQLFAQKHDAPISTAEDKRKSPTDYKLTASGVAVSGKQQGSGNVKSFDVGCFSCHAKDHRVKDCPEKREFRCYNCNEVGHVAKNCTKPTKLSNADVKYVNRGVQSSVLKYRKRVKIGDVDGIDSLVDAGSSDCTIKASLVLEKNFDFIRIPNVLVGFGKPGNEVKSSGIIRETLNVDDCTAKNVSFRVVPDDVQPCDVIINRNFTELPAKCTSESRREQLYIAFFQLERKKFCFESGRLFR